MEQGKGRICSVCGTVNNENAKFCFECGNKFEEQKVCPQCGRTYKEGMKFCPQCGASLINGANITKSNAPASELMADPAIFDENGYIKDESKVFGSSISRNEISFITITDKMDKISSDASQVTNMQKMFKDCGALQKIDVSGFDTSEVTNMSGMFSGCENVGVLDVSRFDTYQVEDMSHMFDGCKNVEQLNTENFDWTYVADLSYMFYNCAKIVKLDLARLKEDNTALEFRKQLRCMFNGCDKLKEIKGMEELLDV